MKRYPRSLQYPEAEIAVIPERDPAVISVDFFRLLLNDDSVVIPRRLALEVARLLKQRVRYIGRREKRMSDRYQTDIAERRKKELVRNNPEMTATQAELQAIDETYERVAADSAWPYRKLTRGGIEDGLSRKSRLPKK